MKLCKWKCNVRLIAIAAVLVAVAGVVFAPDPIHAQGGDNDYVDVGVILEVPEHEAGNQQKLNIIVVNNGSRTAYDVEVVVDIEYPEDSSYFPEIENGKWIVSQVPLVTAPLIVSAGSVSHDSPYSLRWSFPELGGLKRETLVAEVNHTVNTAPPNPFDKRIYPHGYFGKVTTSSFESDHHKGNNETRVWSYRSDRSGRYWQVAGNYVVTVSVDNPSPSPGETVKFTIGTYREEADKDTDTAPPVDLKVAIEMTDGLSVSGNPTVVSGRVGIPVPESVSYSNGVFNVGTLKGPGPNSVPAAEPIYNSVTLPVRVLSDAVVNGQCLTATLTGNPPPGTGPNDDDISDNVAKLCLSAAGTVAGTVEEPFKSGQFDAFTVYPCVDVTDPPCDSTDDFRVRAITPSVEQVLAPGTALLQINPTTARIYDGHENSSNVLQSVNDGNTVSWQTSVTKGRPYTGGLASGIELHYSRTPFAGHESDWKRPTFGISARDVDGNIPPPGKVFLRSTSSGNEFRMAVSPDYEERPTSLSSSAVTASRFHYFLEFERLGTYKIGWHVIVPRNSLHGSEDCLPNMATPPRQPSILRLRDLHLPPWPDSGPGGGERRRQFPRRCRPERAFDSCRQQRA